MTVHFGQLQIHPRHGSAENTPIRRLFDSQKEILAPYENDDRVVISCYQSEGLLPNDSGDKWHFFINKADQNGSCPNFIVSTDNIAAQPGLTADAIKAGADAVLAKGNSSDIRQQESWFHEAVERLAKALRG